MKCIRICFFFFFQAEDGIRDLYVTGVQTCALPISGDNRRIYEYWHENGHVNACLAQLDVEGLTEVERVGLGRAVVCHVGQPAGRCHSRDEHDPAAPALGEPLAEVVGEVEVRDHVELDDLPQPFTLERDERAGIAGTGVRDDEADVEVVRRLGNRVEDAVAAEVNRDDARLNVVSRCERGGDLFQAFLTSRKQDDVNAIGRRLARELLADTRRRARDERPRAIHVLVELLHFSILRANAYCASVNGVGRSCGSTGLRRCDGAPPFWTERYRMTLQFLYCSVQSGLSSTSCGPSRVGPGPAFAITQVIARPVRTTALTGGGRPLLPGGSRRGRVRRRGP